MHGTVATSATSDSMGDDRKPEHLFRGGDHHQGLAGLVTFGHPGLYGDKGEVRDGDGDHLCHPLGKGIKHNFSVGSSIFIIF